ncbi:MAG: Peptidyl-prolyl cis-trans isomerase [Candidatus Tokpelaia hoelldobleri]|uniref:Peptidyl-prolyl cis-trans isomerase n=1 Tax=Candidatus Tokpelaia hoelldobleri TaxID=1902579 RepID=A0A1U9JUM5_9HYPH|nr:MAG: Peptidyl-prolyl cis-trans isomerase [Candidatus Tokpelaia hoelldoblerii]
MNIFHKICSAMVFMMAAFAFAVPAQAADQDNILVLALQNGDVAIQLRPDLAPKHVEQIKKLVREGAYDNVVFHRVIDGFMAQTGDVQYGNKKHGYNAAAAGTGGSKHGNIPAEFSKEPFRRGTVGMARAQAPDSANSQFFICFADAPFLNGQYTVIGTVIKGMDVVDRIKKGDSNNNGAVKNPDAIVKASLVSEVK